MFKPWLFGIAAAFALSSATAIEVIDDAGQRVRLTEPAQRVVSLAPHITEQLFAIGAGTRIVGATEYSDYPAAAQAIPRVGRAHSLDLERIAALKPDLIVTWGSGYPPATQEALHRLRVPVYVNEPKTLESVATSMERLGALTGSAQSPQAAAAFRAQLDTLRARYAQAREVSVFYQIWAQPLMTLGAPHALTEGLRVCGARNVFDKLTAIAPQIAQEAVLAADPELIVTAEPDGRSSNTLAIWQRFGSMRAVKNKQLVTLDANKINRHTPRLIDELAALCEHVDAARKSSHSTPDRSQVSADSTE